MATRTAAHVCNPWCIDDVHAIFFDTMASESQAIVPVAQRLAYNAGLAYLGFTQVRPEKVDPLAADPRFEAQREPLPASRGRIVIWCREGTSSWPVPPSERG